jgi:hypothetical protein
MKSVAFIALILPVVGSPAAAALLPECARPTGSVLQETAAEGSSMDYLETMIRIELEGEAVAMRVSRAPGAALSAPQPCKAKPGELVALGPQDPQE